MTEKRAVVVDLGCGEPERHIRGTIGVDSIEGNEPTIKCNLFPLGGIREVEGVGKEVVGREAEGVKGKEAEGKEAEGKIVRLPFEDESVDIVTSFASMEYIAGGLYETDNEGNVKVDSLVEGMLKALEEIERVLKPGGIFICFDYATAYDEHLEGHELPAETMKQIWTRIEEALIERGSELSLDCMVFGTNGDSSTYAVTLRKVWYIE